MKLLIICDKNGETSFGRLAIDLYRSLSQISQIKPQILWLKTDRYFSLPHEEIEGISLRSLSLATGWFRWRGKFRNLLRQEAPDQVLLIRPELGFLVKQVRRALPTSKVVVMIHDLFAETLYPKSVRYAVINRLFIKGTERADGYLYNSRTTADEASRWFGIADLPSATVGCGINLNAFRPTQGTPTFEERRVFRSTYGLRDYQALVVTVALDEPRKNLDLVLQLAQARPRIAFVRIGQHSRRLEQKAEQLGIENFFQRGPIPQSLLRDYYRFADLVLSPSLLEGFGMTPLEALAAGAEVVCSSIPAHRENLTGVLPLIDPPDRVEGYLKELDRLFSGETVVDRNKANETLERFSTLEVATRVAHFAMELQKRESL